MKPFFLILKETIRTQVLLLFAVCVFLPGCGAGIFYAAAVGMGAFGGHKLYQLKTGGEAEVRFAKPELSTQDQKALLHLKRLAIYPGEREQETVMLAEALSKSGQYDIVSPFSVKEVLPDMARPANFKGMTKQEQIKYAFKVCNELRADGIFVLTHSGSKYRSGSLSFKRSELAYSFQIDLFSGDYKKIIWAQEGDMVLTIGDKMPAEEETQKILISAIAEKFLEDSGKADVITKETSKEDQISAPPKSTPPSIPKEKEPEPAPPVVYLITIKNSNIRTKPTTKSQIITTIKKGTKIEKISESADWFEVRLPSGKTGHVYKPLVIVIP